MSGHTEWRESHMTLRLESPSQLSKGMMYTASSDPYSNTQHGNWGACHTCCSRR